MPGPKGLASTPRRHEPEPPASNPNANRERELRTRTRTRTAKRTPAPPTPRTQNRGGYFTSVTNSPYFFPSFRMKAICLPESDQAGIMTWFVEGTIFFSPC